MTYLRETRVTMTRRELYDLVWGEPVVKLAKRFQLSDRGLAKLCARYRVPRSGRGYWAKKAHGKSVRKTPLPRLKEEKPVTIDIGRTKSSPAERDDPREPVIEVPETLTDPHKPNRENGRVDPNGPSE